MTDNVIQMRDFKTREERSRERAVRRSSAEEYTSPSEITYHDHYINTDKEPA